MSEFQQKDMTGAFFKNEKKTSEDHPDYQGSVTIKGVKFAISGWMKKAKESGKPYMSISVRPWKDTTQKPAPQKAAEPEFKDDSIPW